MFDFIIYIRLTLTLKTADVLQWFPCKNMTSEKQIKCRNSIPMSCQYSDQVSDMSPKWNFCTCLSDVIAW